MTEQFQPLLNSGNYKLRAKARRGYLAVLHGSRCYDCHRVVPDLWNMGRDAQPRENRFEFDHFFPLEIFDTSPRTDIKQFRISGNDCARRSWTIVREHCLNDTHLLCRECHYHRNIGRIRTMRRLYITYGPAPGAPIDPIEPDDPDSTFQPLSGTPPPQQRTERNPVGYSPYWAERIISRIYAANMDDPGMAPRAVANFILNDARAARTWYMMRHPGDRIGRRTFVDGDIYLWYQYASQTSIGYGLMTPEDWGVATSHLRSLPGAFPDYVANVIDYARGAIVPPEGRWDPTKTHEITATARD